MCISPKDNMHMFNRHIIPYFLEWQAYVLINPSLRYRHSNRHNKNAVNSLVFIKQSDNLGSGSFNTVQESQVSFSYHSLPITQQPPIKSFRYDICGHKVWLCILFTMHILSLIRQFPTILIVPLNLRHHKHHVFRKPDYCTHTLLFTDTILPMLAMDNLHSMAQVTQVDATPWDHI